MLDHSASSLITAKKDIPWWQWSTLDHFHPSPIKTVSVILQWSQWSLDQSDPSGLSTCGGCLKCALGWIPELGAKTSKPAEVPNPWCISSHYTWQTCLCTEVSRWACKAHTSEQCQPAVQFRAGAETEKDMPCLSTYALPMLRLSCSVAADMSWFLQRVDSRERNQR